MTQSIGTPPLTLVITSDRKTANTLSDAGRPAIVLASMDFGAVKATAMIAKVAFGSSVLIDADRPDAGLLETRFARYGIQVERCDFNALRWLAALP